MRRFFHSRHALAAALLALAGTAAWAQDYTLGQIHIDEPYARATAPGQPAGGGFVTLHNAGKDDRLVSARSPVAERVELHTMRMDGDVMRMRQVDAIELPAGKAIALKPGGFHMMLMGLKNPLKAGESFPLTLKFAQSGEVTVQMKVQAVGAAAAPAQEHKH